MNANSTRSLLRGLVGAYLLYLAYQLLKGLLDNIETTMPRWVAILAIAGFGVIGVVFLVSAWRAWLNGRKDQDEHPVELEDEKAREETGENGPGK